MPCSLPIPTWRGSWLAAAGLAAVLLARGQVIEAEALAHRALAADAQRHRVWHILALALERQGRLGEALAAAERAAQLAPAEDAYPALVARLAAESSGK